MEYVAYSVLAKNPTSLINVANIGGDASMTAVA